MMVCRSLLIATLAASAVGCSDELSFSDYEKYDVGMWVSPPDGNQVFLGVVQGAAACGAAASNYARNRNYSSSARGYVCCTHRTGSDCHEKIR